MEKLSSTKGREDKGRKGAKLFYASGLVPFRSQTCREVGVITILHMQKLTLTDVKELIQVTQSVHGRAGLKHRCDPIAKLSACLLSYYTVGQR